MNNKVSNPKPDPLESLMKWEEAFQELLDQIYWKGYSQQLVRENPEAYKREYFYFRAIYDYSPYSEM